MNSAAEIESAVKSGEKRAAKGGGGPEAKKVKREGLVEDMRKVAEMVLVLAAMGKMRGGRVPTEAEMEIMSDARNKLAEVCQCFAPKDVFPRDMFGGIIEDLGLNKVKEQRLGFRPPKISIAEKLMFSKRKMEKSDDLSQPSTTNTSQRLYANSSAAVDGRGPSPAARGFPSDKPGHLPISSGRFQPASPLVHAASTISSALPYQLPTSEVRPVVSGGLPSNHLVKDSTSVALQKTDRPQFRLDGRPNGSSHTTQLQANSYGDHTVGKPPAWLAQPHAVPSARIASETKVTTQSVFKVEGAADARPGMAPHMSSSKPFITPSSSVNTQSVHQHFLGLNTVQAPLARNPHFDICKTVQKFLQPRNSDRPLWTPPSRDYMTKAFTCQVCKFTANDVDSVLVCDACEKGFHLKCLQINNPKGVPRSEWHCLKCLQLSNGKPLPPKYGRVMRNMNVSKAAPNTTSIQTSSERKDGSLNEKVNQQKIKANGNTSFHSSATANAVNNFSHQISVSKIANSSEMRGNNIAGRVKVDEKASSGTSSNEITETSVPTLFPSGSSVKSDYEGKPLDSKPYPPANHEAFQSFSTHSQSLANREGNQQSGLSNVAVLLKQSLDNHSDNNHLKEPSGGHSLCNKTQESSGDDRGTVRGNPAEASTTSAGHTALRRSMPHNVHSVDWVGGTVRVDDDRIFFHSCCINGVIYKLQEYVLIRFNNDRLVPSKLQAMWEDRMKKTKWVTVNRFYFPGDLPEAVGRPCGLETCEVYEAFYSCNVMAGSIEGPCEVLPPSQFSVEKEKRASLGTGPNANLRPLFLRKWIYDESKMLFRDASC